MSVDLQWNENGVYRKFSGRFSESDVQQSNQRIARDRQFPSLQWSIADFLDAEVDEDSPLNFYDAVAGHEAVTAAMRRRESKLFTAAVATDPRTIAHLRFFDSLKLPPHPVRLFGTIDEARAWIADHCPSATR